MSFQQSVHYNYAAGLPGEVIADGPMRASPFRLIANPDQAPSPAIGFGLGFTYSATEVVNPDGLATSQVAVPGGKDATSRFAGILIQPKEHALYGTAAGALTPTYNLPDGSFGELCRMGILLAVVKAAAATDGVPGSKLAMELATGAIVAYAGNLPADTLEIPGAQLLTNIGLQATGALAKIELTGIGVAVTSP